MRQAIHRGIFLAALLCACAAPPARTPGATPTATIRPPTATPDVTAASWSLVPWEAAEWGMRGVAPDGWIEAEPGHFMPPERIDWETRLIHEFYPDITVHQLADALLIPVLQLEQLPEPLGGHPSSRLPWHLYSLEVPLSALTGSTIDLALAETEAGVYLVALLAPSEQRIALYDAIFDPAVRSLEPIQVDDSDRYYELNLPLFAYDATAPLDVQESRSYPLRGRIVTDLTYASPKGGRVPATVIVPEGSGPFAGMILQHGMPGRRLHMQSLGERYAGAGAVVIAIDAPHARTEHQKRTSEPITYAEQDREEQIQLMIDLRRAVDLLLEWPDVDPDRLAYVGISYGGAMGGLFAGIEHRLQAYVLVVGDGGLVSHETGLDDVFGGLYGLRQEQREKWWDGMWPIEPIHYVSHAAPAALLFQSGRQDRQVPLPDAVRYQLAGSKPKDVMWYDAGHSLSPESLRDQAAWLESCIGIDADAMSR